MLSRINCFPIVAAHLRTFKDYDTKEWHKPDFVLFFAVPLAAAYLGLRFIPILNKDLVNVMVTAFSVFAALLFNLLLLIFEITRRAKAEPSTKVVKLEILEEMYANISYGIFVSIVSIIVLLVPLLNIDIPGWSLTFGHSDKAVSFITYFLIANFVLTLLMILNRVHMLFTREFKEQPPSDSN